MKKQFALGVLLVAFSLLTACQLQLNQSKGLTLQIIIPHGTSSGGKSIAGSMGAKTIAGPSSACVQVTIMTSSEAPYATSELIPINGKSSVNYTFPLPPPGTYMASAQLMDSSGLALGNPSTPVSFAIPAQSGPVVMTMPDNPNLYTEMLVDSNGTTYALTPTFSPMTYSYTGPLSSGAVFTLTLTTVDPNATITSVTVNSSTISPSSPGIYSGFTLNFSSNQIVIGVTAVDGTAQTYTIAIPGGG